MVAVDHSFVAQYAYQEALRGFDVENDYLYIIAVSQFMLNFPANGMSASVLVEAQRESDRNTHTLLIHYVSLCKRAQVKNFKTFLGKGAHAGEIICKAAEGKAIDILYLGRRSLGTFKRIFVGSTSRYCVENAPCSVACIKLPPHLEDQAKKDIQLETSKLKEDHGDHKHEQVEAVAPPATSVEHPAHTSSVTAINAPPVEQYQ